MTNDINKPRPMTGRVMREDSSVINTADLAADNTAVLTTTPLIIDAVYTGATIDTLSLSPVPQYAFAYSWSNVASATTGFIIEQSDAANMGSPSTIVSATAGAAALATLAPTAITQRYFRVKYTNAHANPQTTFVLVFGYSYGDLPVAPASTAVYSGTVVAPVTSGTAVVLTANQACRFVKLQAPVGNTQSVVWGSSSSTCTLELLADTYSPELNVSNVNKIYVKSAGDATQTVNWVARD